MLKKYEKFLETNTEINRNNDELLKLEESIPDEISNSALIIAKSMYEKVKKYSFFKENGDFFIKFEISDMDFKYIDPTEVLPLNLSSGSMEKRKYYVELSYDDQIPSTNEVIYKIISEKIS